MRLLILFAIFLTLAILITGCAPPPAHNVSVIVGKGNNADNGTESQALDADADVDFDIKIGNDIK